jgi:hypothetical protein
MNDDERLKEGFAKLRKVDERRAPPFDAMWRAPGRKRSPWIVVLPIGGAVAAAAAAVLLFIDVQHDASAPTAAAPVPAIVAAAPAMLVPALEPSPLDFLLDVPGHASLTTAPDFDRSLIQGRRR